MFTQCQTEIGIHVIERKLSFLVRTLYQQFYSLIAQQPDTDVHQEQMGLHQLTEFFHRWFLKHKVQLVRCSTGRHEYPVVLRQVRVYPQAIANDIRFGNLLQRFAGTNTHIATGNQGMQRIGSIPQDFLIQRELQRQEVLRQSLATCPTEDWNRRQDLS